MNKTSPIYVTLRDFFKKISCRSSCCNSINVVEPCCECSNYNDTEKT